MSEKFRRNEPCWCGSGKKYKHCHWLRAEKKAPTIEENIYAWKKLKRSYCMHPNANNGTCQGDVIRAHTIQRNGGLSRISRDGHVYQYKTDYPLPKIFSPRKIGIHEATTFTGFCKKHDNAIFRPIEDYPFQSCKEHSFLLAYRAISRELYAKRAQVKSVDYLRTMDRGSDLLGQINLQNFVDAFESGSSRALADLEHYKNLYDQRLLSEDYSDTNYYIIRFASIPDIMCSAVLFPEVDFHGNVLQDLLRIGSISERGAHLTYSLIATDEGGAAVFSWIGDDLAPIQFVNSLDKLKDQEIPNALLRFNFEFFENTAISPDWWDNLTMEQQQLISNRLSKAVSFNTERKPDCLVDDGLRAVTWSVISRETNLSF